MNIVSLVTANQVYPFLYVVKLEKNNAPAFRQEAVFSPNPMRITLEACRTKGRR